MAVPTRARSTSPPPLPPAPADEVRRPAFQFPANDNRPPLRNYLLGLAGVMLVATALAVLSMV
jgi:hypothetical protein